MAYTIVKTLLAAAFCLISVQAVPWQITDPVASTVWKAGDTVNIVWAYDGSVKPSSITIQLLAGNTLFDTPAANAAPNALKVSYVVKKTGFPSSDQYYLRIGTGASDYTYSHTFSIQGDGLLVPGQLPPNTTAVITGGASAPVVSAANPASPSGARSTALPSALPSGSKNGTAGNSTAAPSSASAVHELKSFSFVIALIAAVGFWGV